MAPNVWPSASAPPFGLGVSGPAPVALIPVYRQSATLGLAVGAVFGLVAAAVLLAAPARWVDAPA